MNPDAAHGAAPQAESGGSSPRIFAPSIAEVERIAAVDDPVVRNFGITDCYHRLAAALAGRLPGDANWCAFAAWASKQAGQTIRGEDLRRAMEQRLDGSPAARQALDLVVERLRALGAKSHLAEIRRVLGAALGLDSAAARASSAVARGNLKVFAEIGREFARFLEERCDDQAPDAAKMAAFSGGLREGEPPEGQRLLRQAFARCYEALFEPAGKARAQMLLLANLEVGLHEQTRLQPEILEALNASVPDPEVLTERLLSALFPRRSVRILKLRRALRRLTGGATPLDRAMAALVETVRRELRLFLTERFVMLALSGGVVLHLGRDLDVPFPDALVHIENPDLSDMLARIDPTPDDLRRSGAADWSDLAARMRFIADFFRCYHESAGLFDPPFDPAQTAAIRAGAPPSGTAPHRAPSG